MAPKKRGGEFTPDEIAVKLASETLERQLIFGMMRSYLFYLDMRKTLCPYDAEAATFRPDFTVARYNTLYRAIDAYWRFSADALNAKAELVGDPVGVIAYVIDWANSSVINMNECNELQAEIEAEATLAAQLNYEVCRNIVQTPGFKQWMEKRILENELEKLNSQFKGGKLTLDLLRTQATTIQSGVSYKSNAISGGAVLRGSRTWTPAYSCSLKDINAATGGGFRKGEAWMAAALTGCGKTILANQFLWDFARGGAKVVLVTTEQTPAVLIPRVISNTTSTPFSDFVKSSAINLSDIEKTTTIPNIPAYMWTDPNKAARMQVVEQVLIDNVKFVDWTGSNKHSITEHLACEIDALRTTGWIPDVIIFDWLGGALEGTDTPDKLRLIFKQGADFFATYCQTNNYLGIMFQQLAQGLALNKKIVHVNMLAEAKNTVEKFDGFLGISGMHEAEKNIDDAIVTKPKLMRKQYIHVGKTRNGEGGVCGVAQEFVYQRFGDWEKVNQLTQPQ